MLKLKKLKAEADAKKALETEAAAAGRKPVAKASAGELILQKEVGDLKDVESEQIVVNFPDPDNLMCCEITIKPGAAAAFPSPASSAVCLPLVPQLDCAFLGKRRGCSVFPATSACADSMRRLRSCCACVQWMGTGPEERSSSR